MNSKVVLGTWLRHSSSLLALFAVFFQHLNIFVCPSGIIGVVKKKKELLVKKGESRSRKSRCFAKGKMFREAAA